MNPTDIKYIIDEIHRLKYKLNTWEKDYIESISRQTIFSFKQEACLNEIYKRAAGGGRFERRQVI